MSRRLAEVVINLSSLRHNARLVRRFAPQSKVWGTIKAQGYGHGAVRVAGAIRDLVDGFAVACVGEAAELREAGFGGDTPIVVLNGPADEQEFREVLQLGLQPVVHQPWHLKFLQEHLAAPGARKPDQVWLKVNSGMGRVGVLPQEAPAYLKQLGPAADSVGVMTHMACADEPENPATQRQLETFLAAVEGHPGPRSAANSACIMHWPQTHLDWVRPGLMLYGCTPFGPEFPTELQPAMTLTSRLIAINELPADHAVGYGCTYRTPEAMRVGVIGIGYGDGYPRVIRPGTVCLVNGKRTPIVGRVSMDKITVDLRGHPASRVGDEVVMWGPGLPVEEIAAAAGTINYELTCSVFGRIPVRVVE